MNVIQTVLISGLTASILAMFTSIATFLVNRYAPRIADHIEKRFKRGT